VELGEKPIADNSTVMLTTKQKMMVARFAQIMVMGTRQVVGLSAAAQVKRRGVRWDLDLTEGIDFSIWLLGSFEPGTVRCYQGIVKAGDVVLDIGANIGAHTLHLAECVGPQGKVVAFEPTDYAFSKLGRNSELNPELAARIQCKQYMLVDSEALNAPTVPLYSSWPLKHDEGRHDLHRGRLMTTSGASPRTLDSAISSLGLTRVDCIKLDIDGFECGMLRGAREVLTRWHPTIIMELAPYALEEQGASLDELIQLLKAYGYGLYSASTDKPLEMDAAKLQQLIPHGASMNVLAYAPLGRMRENQAGTAEAGKDFRKVAV
jgi:FkbM family methyltransferase